MVSATTFQTHQHHAAWVIFYSPVDEAQLQKAKSLGVSVMDILGALTADLNWTQILDNRACDDENACLAKRHAELQSARAKGTKNEIMSVCYVIEKDNDGICRN